MDANEALNSFDLDPRLFYDAISYSTDDYLYIIDMKTDTCPDACSRGSSPGGASS